MRWWVRFNLSQNYLTGENSIRLQICYRLKKKKHASTAYASMMHCYLRKNPYMMRLNVLSGHFTRYERTYIRREYSCSR